MKHRFSAAIAPPMRSPGRRRALRLGRRQDHQHTRTVGCSASGDGFADQVRPSLQEPRRSLDQRLAVALCRVMRRGAADLILRVVNDSQTSAALQWDGARHGEAVVTACRSEDEGLSAGSYTLVVRVDTNTASDALDVAATHAAPPVRVVHIEPDGRIVLDAPGSFGAGCASPRPSR